VASRFEETPVYFIGGESVVTGRAKQLALSFS